ncbi:menaquinol oxidoreductase, partial [bacterium]|nr:menaquinol oxidoreductase [bacterium]
EVVRDAERVYIAKDGKPYLKSLTKTCMQCHKQNSEIKSATYCLDCHDEVGISTPSCWECHIDPKEL